MSVDSRLVWPIRVLAGVGVAVTLGVLVLFAMLFSAEWGWHERPRAEVRTNNPAETYVVADVTPIRGTSLVRIDITAAAADGLSSYSKGREALRNLLLLDTRTGTSRRLLPDNKAMIRQSWMLPAHPTAPGTDDDASAALDVATGSGDAAAAPRTFFLLLVERDLALSLVAGRLDGGPAATLMRGIDGVDAVWMQDQSHLGLLLRAQRRLFLRVVDTGRWRVVASRPVEVGT